MSNHDVLLRLIEMLMTEKDKNIELQLKLKSLESNIEETKENIHNN